MRKKTKAVTGFTLTMVMALGFAVFFYLNFKTVVVSGESMLPTFKSGQRVLVSKAYWLIGGIRPKDIVVIADENPENTDGYLIKRVYKWAARRWTMRTCRLSISWQTEITSFRKGTYTCLATIESIPRTADGMDRSRSIQSMER